MGFTTIAVNAPQFPSNLTWLNSPPLMLKEVLGRVVLIDFWTYSCINCQRTIPYLRKWWDTYKDHGLVIIGVHTPEFEFEKKTNNVKTACKKYQIGWPIVLDNENLIWDLYSNHFWPAKYLIDHRGKIIYTHFGEGNYIETEVKIQTALKEAGFKVSDKLVSQFDRESGGLWKTQTPETYLGFQRGSIGNSSGIIPNRSNEYKLSKGQFFEPDLVYLKGNWRVEKEYLQHGVKTDDLDDLIILNYRAKEVYLVMESEDGEPIKLYITLDGVGLNSENSGKDVKFDKEGRSYVELQFATLYNLISSHTYGDHILRLSTTSDKLRCFAFTFGL